MHKAAAKIPKFLPLGTQLTLNQLTAAEPGKISVFDAEKMCRILRRLDCEEVDLFLHFTAWLEKRRYSKPISWVRFHSMYRQYILSVT